MMKNNQTSTPATNPDGTKTPSMNDLLWMGEGDIGYLKQLNADEIANLPMDLEIDQVWGVFSAKGEPIALCDGPRAAFEFFSDHNLRAVSIH